METDRIKILFATETGNSEDLANRTAETAEEKGFEVDVQNVEDFDLADLASETCLVFIGSTMGEGEPPESAWDFHDALTEEQDLDLSGLSYSVVALGDKSYGDLFCAFGKKIDGELARLGAKCVVPRKDCDVDFDAPYASWSKAFFAAVTSAS